MSELKGIGGQEPTPVVASGAVSGETSVVLGVTSEGVPKAASKAASGPVPGAVDVRALTALAETHHDRAVRPLGTREIAGHLVKVYAIEAPGRGVAEREEAAALRVAGPHLELGRARGSLGLAVLILHAGGDGDYVLVQTWVEASMSDLAVFLGPAGRPDELRPGRVGLAPCVWEAAVLAHERDAYVRNVLDGTGPVAERLAAWGADVTAGHLR
ncbi:MULTISPECIES: hypothetical protein [unclassified Streptomyces]|uniref:hypothetical protein n=1 Tax=unclassified Streptomyces TaxID=2593676 RepID=UPI00136D85D1|nr:MULTISPECIES: hypothetical protein [unclassified Streptomyces]NEA03249.1 hypothetical protein [Streptomyces sp. SID10116]MYY86668.1 hypothetical protein [Streptomyces sp. SID335]MYZ12747.1 hypothetical protein [Streptomyces sp. SID337]NDZ91641.1 hypothetical protein [Streptomyces sp. SID10115]NEB45886.1 hypothetical protein [Streptomyces sp. SID339]